MGHYSSRTQINAGDQNGATIRVTSQAIIEVKPAALVLPVIQLFLKKPRETSLSESLL